MIEKKLLQYLIVIYWSIFYLTTVIDKIIPDVFPLWVGADFYTLFIKLFASLGITHPIFATIVLTLVSCIEIFSLVCFSFALYFLYKSNGINSIQWFQRGIGSSIFLFCLFSIGDQIFGDRFTLLEHGVFWIILIVSWVAYADNNLLENNIIQFTSTRELNYGLWIGTLLTLCTCFSLFAYSKETFDKKTKSILGEEVVEHVFKFDIPFLGDKVTVENTIKEFERTHPDLKINYIYTGPDELNSKKKTHLLLYVFTEKLK